MAATCANPDCVVTGTKRCARCKKASYCSSTCQTLDWQHHKSACKSSTTSNAKVLPKQCSNPGCTSPPEYVKTPCGRCNDATYCTSFCQKEDWEGHKRSCHNSIPAPIIKQGLIKAVRIHSKTGGGGHYSRHPTIHLDPIFRTRPVPISQKIGFPLLVQHPSFPSLTRNRETRGELTDNPHATWLMIDPNTGFAPAEWQSEVGDVVVARPDGQALETATLAAITDYISDILDAFGDGLGPPRKYYNRDRLDKFMADHAKMQEEFKQFQSQAKDEFANTD